MLPFTRWTGRGDGLDREYVRNTSRHFVYRRYVSERTREPDSVRVHVTLLDNAEHLPDDYVREMLATEQTNPVFL